MGFVFLGLVNWRSKSAFYPTDYFAFSSPFTVLGGCINGVQVVGQFRWWFHTPWFGNYGSYTPLLHAFVSKPQHALLVLATKHNIVATKQNKLCELPTDPQSGLALLLYQPSYLCFSTDNSKYIRLKIFFMKTDAVLKWQHPQVASTNNKRYQ